jgi:hypothetical protein
MSGAAGTPRSGLFDDIPKVGADGTAGHPFFPASGAPGARHACDGGCGGDELDW